MVPFQPGQKINEETHLVRMQICSRRKGSTYHTDTVASRDPVTTTRPVGDTSTHVNTRECPYLEQHKRYSGREEEETIGSSQRQEHTPEQNRSQYRQNHGHRDNHEWGWGAWREGEVGGIAIEDNSAVIKYGLYARIDRRHTHTHTHTHTRTHTREKRSA